MDKVLAFSKKLLKEVIDKNSIVVDATAGNGNDTLFLAKTPAKKVFAFDVQNKAITNTNDLLEKIISLISARLSLILMKILINISKKIFKR